MARVPTLRSAPRELTDGELRTLTVDAIMARNEHGDHADEHAECAPSARRLAMVWQGIAADMVRESRRRTSEFLGIVAQLAYDDDDQEEGALLRPGEDPLDGFRGEVSS